MSVRVTAGAALVACSAAWGQVHESDVLLGVDQGRIVTGAIDPGAGVPVFPVRVFASEFGIVPNWTDEPGFDSEPGTFAPGLAVGFDFTRAVRRWENGAFEVIPPERIRITKGAASAVSPTGDVRTPGLVIGEANGAGVFHHHVGYELLAPAQQGVYLLEIVLWSAPGAPAESELVWIVFGQDADPGEHQQAVQWVLVHLAGVCRADLNGDGALDLFDFLTFANLFNAMDPKADFNGDGVFDLFDYLTFVNEFNAGCP